MSCDCNHAHLRENLSSRLNHHMANQCTKSDRSSFIHSRDMNWAHKNQNGSRDVTMPFHGWFVFRKLRLTCVPNMRSLFTHYKDVKRNAKCRNWGAFGLKVTQGHRQQPFNNAYMTSYLTLIETMHLSCITFEYSEFSVLFSFAVFWPTNLHLSPPLGRLHSNFNETFGIRKLESLSYYVALYDSTFNRFDTIPGCDRQTHTDTMKASREAASMTYL